MVFRKKLREEVGRLTVVVDCLSQRVAELECSHTEWSYDEHDGWLSPIRYRKTCAACGKEVCLTKEEWLQEQADEAYKKHEQLIERINNMEEK